MYCQCVQRNPFRSELAAGILLVSGNYFFSALRSALVNCPGVWSIPGGSVDEEETPLQGAHREFIEELGSLPYQKEFLMKTHYMTDDDLLFITYIYKVDPKVIKNWKIRLNWENDRAAWFRIDSPPTNIHPGLEYSLACFRQGR